MLDAILSPTSHGWHWQDNVFYGTSAIDTTSPGTIIPFFWPSSFTASINNFLVLLNILTKWGRRDFHPSPKEVVHFDIIFPLPAELRQWSGNITLMKVKSLAGCLMNERADEFADAVRTARAVPSLQLIWILMFENPAHRSQTSSSVPQGFPETVP